MSEKAPRPLLDEERELERLNVLSLTSGDAAAFPAAYVRMSDVLAREARYQGR